jgi:hypothetical protein
MFDFECIKIVNEIESIQLQEYLLSYGYRWKNNAVNKTIELSECYVMLSKDLILSWNYSPSEEFITFKEFLSIIRKYKINTALGSNNE